MKTNAKSWPRSLKFLLFVPLIVVVLAFYGLSFSGTIPKDWKGWVILILALAPCGALIEYLSPKFIDWIEKRFGRASTFGFILAIGILGILLACYFSPG